MDFRSLRYFMVVAEELNITRAAGLLKMSQPPLSNRIKQLEQDLGTTLFIRKRNGLILTPTGEILYKRARQMMELSERTREEIIGFEKELSGNLILGTVEGRAPFLLARWISGFRDEFPLVTYNVRHGGSDDILEQLYHHLIDIAIIASPYNHELLEGFSVGTQPWVAIMPCEHPLAKKEGRQISLSELKGEPLILPERTSRLESIEQWFSEQGMVPNMICRLSSYINAVALVEQGVGICIFPQTTYSPNPYVVTKLITDTPKYAEYVLVYLKDHPLSELAQSFVDYVKDFQEEKRIHTTRFMTKEEEFAMPENATLL